MITAILKGIKAQTRRVIKYKKTITDPNVGFSAFCPEGEFEVRGYHENGDYGSSFFKAPIMKGDILWVRETWEYSDDLDEPYLYKQKYQDEYKPEYFDRMKWKPSIFMPKEACRIFLKVTNVRVERLDKISGEDAFVEGVGKPFRSGARNMASLQIDYNSWEDKQVTLFQSLWESINGAGSWEKNPFVWVCEFERIEKPEVWP